MPDYGQAGLYGIGTPQANPTVEAEFRILLPNSAMMAVTRLASSASDPMERLVAYIEDLDTFLDGFDTMKLDVFGLACTASSYLVGPEREAEIVKKASARLNAPVETATLAILKALDAVNARRIAVVAPYPQDLIDAGVRYWQAAGLEIVEAQRVVTRSEDTRTIYELSSANAAAVLAEMDLSGIDAVLLSGTGMPSLPVIAAQADGPPILSSNLCLAWSLLHLAGRADLAGNTPADIAGWRQRLPE